MLIGIFFDVPEILGFLALFFVIGALIMALGGPLGIIRTAISNSDQEQRHLVELNTSWCSCRDLNPGRRLERAA